MIKKTSILWSPINPRKSMVAMLKNTRPSKVIYFRAFLKMCKIIFCKK
jgi:hypothetical protein